MLQSNLLADTLSVVAQGVVLFAMVLYTLPFGNGAMTFLCPTCRVLRECRTPDSRVCVSARSLQSGMEGEQADTIRRIQARAFVCGSLPEHLSVSLRELLDVLLQVDAAMRPSASVMQQMSCGVVAAEGALRWLAEAPSTPVALGAELAASPLPDFS